MLGKISTQYSPFLDTKDPYDHQDIEEQEPPKDLYDVTTNNTSTCMDSSVVIRKREKKHYNYGINLKRKNKKL